MKALLLIVTTVFICNLTFAYEGVVHGIKTMNGNSESFDIFIKGDKICVEGVNSQGFFKIIFDRGSDEVIICVDSPYYKEKGYFKIDLANKSNDNKIEVISSNQNTIEKEGKTYGVFSAITSTGSAMIEVNPEGNADISGLSKYMDDPVYELIDHYNIKNTIEKIDVDKPNEKYSIVLSATEQNLTDDIFSIPSGYVPFVLETK